MERRKRPRRAGAVDKTNCASARRPALIGTLETHDGAAVRLAGSTSGALPPHASDCRWNTHG